MRGAIAAGILALAGGAAAQGPAFDYSPMPRWAEDPDTEVVCAAVRAECAAKLRDGLIDAEWTYAEYYDADGMLVGVHSLQSSASRWTSTSFSRTATLARCSPKKGNRISTGSRSSWRPESPRAR